MFRAFSMLSDLTIWAEWNTRRCHFCDFKILFSFLASCRGKDLAWIMAKGLYCADKLRNSSLKDMFPIFYHPPIWLACEQYVKSHSGPQKFIFLQNRFCFRKKLLKTKTFTPITGIHILLIKLQTKKHTNQQQKTLNPTKSFYFGKYIWRSLLLEIIFQTLWEICY